MLVLTSVAHAAPVKVDWARGLVIADAIGLADRHAPNPTVARGPSRRRGEDAARKRLAAQIGALPIAGGGTIGDRAKANEAIRARLDRAVAGALTVAAEPQTDGSWRVTLAVPLEAVRQALAGPRTASGDSGPQVVIVDGVSAPPAIGWKIGGLEAPTLWVDAVPGWAKDAPRVTAKRAKAGEIEIDGSEATAATLFVIVTAR